MSYFYLCTNHSTKECQNKLLDNGITFLTGKHATRISLWRKL